MDPSNYLLAGGRAELERLRLQAEVWEEDAATLFDQIPVKPGWECIDVGCGTMGVLRPLMQHSRAVADAFVQMFLDVQWKDYVEAGMPPERCSASSRHRG